MWPNDGFMRALIKLEGEVRINGANRPIVIDLHPNPMAPTEHAFRKLQRVTEMTIKVVKRGGKPGLPVGFAEVVLDEKKK